MHHCGGSKCSISQGHINCQSNGTKRSHLKPYKFLEGILEIKKQERNKSSKIAM